MLSPDPTRLNNLVLHFSHIVQACQQRVRLLLINVLTVRGRSRPNRRRRGHELRRCEVHLFVCQNNLKVSASFLSCLPRVSGSAESCVCLDAARPKTGLSRCPSDSTTSQRLSLCHPNPLCAALINAPH